MAGLLAAGLAVATTGRPLPGDPRTVAGTFAATTDAESAAKDPWITEKRDGALAARALADGALVAGARVAGALVAGAALITVAALVKAPAAAALAFLPFLVPAARIRAAAIVATTAATVAIVLTAASGLGWGWVHTLGAGNARRSLMSVSTGVGVLASNVAGAGAVDVAHTIGLLMAATIGAGLLVRANRLGALRALGLTLLAAVVLSPVVQPWYLLWALPALAATAGARLAVGVAASSAVLCLLVLPSGRHVIRPPLYGVPAVLTIAVGYAAARSSHSKEEISSTT
jgi:alpha-1,6-mannosyltransferase